MKIKPRLFKNYFAQEVEGYNRGSRYAGRGLLVDGENLIANLEPSLSRKINLKTGETITLDKKDGASITNLAITRGVNGKILLGGESAVLQVDTAFKLERVWQWDTKKDFWAIYPQDDRYLWVGLGRDNGIGLLDMQNGELLESSTYKLFSVFQGKNVIYIAPDEKGTLWFCSNAGLYSFNSKASLPELPNIHVSHEELWIEKVNNWLEANYHKAKIKIIDWAEAVNMSESHFRRKLKQVTGLSPGQYLNEYRLHVARQLLEKQAFPTVAQIAFESGFSGADYFSVVYQKRFGKRPSGYLIAS